MGFVSLNGLLQPEEIAATQLSFFTIARFAATTSPSEDRCPRYAALVLSEYGWLRYRH